MRRFSFGHPLSLRAFAAETDRELAAPLARELMRRIGRIVPVLPVPLVSWLLLNHGPMTRTALEARMDDLVRRMPYAHIHMPRHDREYAVKVGLRHLAERGIVSVQDRQIQPVEAERDLLEFYANSIRHLIPDDEVVISAPAKEISASARS